MTDLTNKAHGFELIDALQASMSSESSEAGQDDLLLTASDQLYDSLQNPVVLSEKIWVELIADILGHTELSKNGRKKTENKPALRGKAEKVRSRLEGNLAKKK